MVGELVTDPLIRAVVCLKAIGAVAQRAAPAEARLGRLSPLPPLWRL
jgi:hypothetical protein